MDNENILECGIRIIAQPPGKKLQNIMLLSGGERALTAIALLFAIQNLKPSPFCLLDEIEAALDDANMILEGVNPSCGDDIFLNLKFEDGVIKDGSFQGDGCAISQASADMMLDLIVGKTKEEALQLADIFLRMIKGEASDDEIDQLEEASVLKDISHMPARVKCAVLGWRTLNEMFKDGK